MNIRIVRKKIKSITNVRKITKAMQMVSAVKMKRAQQAEVESRPYRDGLTELIRRISNKIEPSDTALLQVDTSKAKKTILIVVTSNKGLAGAFNININRHILKSDRKFQDTDFVTVGSKAAQFLGRLENCNVIADFSGKSLVSESSAIFSFVLEKYFTGEYRSVDLVYNRFISTLKSEVIEETILPLTSVGADTSVQDEKEANKPNNTEYVIEPTPQEILDELLKSFIEQKIRGALISSEAVEHAARMMAMKSATDNATELIYSLTLLANRLRQEKITNELLDMITAKESVEA